MKIRLSQDEWAKMGKEAQIATPAEIAKTQFKAPAPKPFPVSPEEVKKSQDKTDKWILSRGGSTSQWAQDGANLVKTVAFPDKTSKKFIIMPTGEINTEVVQAAPAAAPAPAATPAPAPTVASDKKEIKVASADVPCDKCKANLNEAEVAEGKKDNKNVCQKCKASSTEKETKETVASTKQTIKMSKTQWQTIGKTAGWLK